MQFYGRTWIGNQPMEEIAKSVKKIEKHLGNMYSTFRRLKVDIYDKKDREIEKEERDKRFTNTSSDQKPKNESAG